jgi:hypothetical protein
LPIAAAARGSAPQWRGVARTSHEVVKADLIRERIGLEDVDVRGLVQQVLDVLLRRVVAECAHQVREL